MGRRVLTLLLVAGLAIVLTLRAGSCRPARRPGAEPAARSGPQPRPHGDAVPVDPATITVDDGDTVLIRWPGRDPETVRILGIDTPEVRHDEHNIPEDQPFGQEARGFARGAFAAATEVRLLRASKLDPYGRTLGYLFLNGKNYSVLAIRARLSDETVSFYGDNGLPEPAAEVTAAARGLPALGFEPPHAFRKRMRTLSEGQKAKRREP
ncbi:MAG: thermonuclease family protein [Isosphaeraceae bacterium]